MPVLYGKGKGPDDMQKVEEICVAIPFAHTFIHDKKLIDDNMFHVLKQYWTEKEIVELALIFVLLLHRNNWVFYFNYSQTKH